MKALVLREYMQLIYEDVPEPEIGPEDVLIQVKACGICGSDVHGIDGSTKRRVPPLIMGHEAAGVIAAVGANVTGWEIGDKVSVEYSTYCGQCYFCRKGLTNLCDHRRAMGVSTDQRRENGAFAEYLAWPQQTLHHLPSGVSFAQAAIVEPLSVALHAVERTPISIGDTAVVLGVGPIGLNIIQCLRVAGCGLIIAVDLDQTRLELAHRLGADIGLRPDVDDVLAGVFKYTTNRGADVAIEAVGITPTINLGIRCLRKGGTLTLVGTFAQTPELLLQEVVYRQLNLLGAVASCGEFPACLDLIARGEVNVDAIVSAVAPLADGPSWFERLYSGEKDLIKVILSP